MKLNKCISFMLCVLMASTAVLSGCNRTTEQSTGEESTGSSAVSQDSDTQNVPSQQESSFGEDSAKEQTEQNPINLLTGESYDVKDDLISRGINTDGLFYFSSDELVLSVDISGTIKAMKAGTVKLKVKDASSKIVIEYTVTIKEKNNRPNTITPTVWEVTDDEGNIIYMMGTIHAADKEVYNMPDYFEAAYSKCDSLAVECDTVSQNMDFFNTLKMIQKYVYTGGDSIKNHVTAKAYENAEKLLTESGSFSPAYMRYKPAMWLSLLEAAVIGRSDLSYDYGVDTILLKRAFAEGKNVLELESVDFQMNLLSEIPEVVSILEFESYADENVVEENVRQLKELYQNWKAGTITEENVGLDNKELTMDDILDEAPTEEDIQVINGLLTRYTGSQEHNIRGTELTEENKKAITDMVNESMKQYNQMMLYDRNAGMVKKAREYMQSENVVMMVAGAAHFQGDKGIIRLIEQEGCKVRELTSADAGELNQTFSVVNSADENRKREETDPAVPKTA